MNKKNNNSIGDCDLPLYIITAINALQLFEYKDLTSMTALAAYQLFSVPAFYSFNQLLNCYSSAIVQKTSDFTQWIWVTSNMEEFDSFPYLEIKVLIKHTFLFPPNVLYQEQIYSLGIVNICSEEWVLRLFCSTI